jgi:hypothetical protein
MYFSLPSFVTKNGLLCNQNIVSIYESILESLAKYAHIMFMGTGNRDLMMDHHSGTHKQIFFPFSILFKKKKLSFELFVYQVCFDIHSSFLCFQTKRPGFNSSPILCLRHHWGTVFEALLHQVTRRIMANFDEVQSSATEQGLREQNQLLRKQLEDMNAQMQALMAQLQGNTTAQSSQLSQEAQPQDQEYTAPPPSAQATVQINVPQQEPAYLPPMAAPQAHIPQLVTPGQLTNQNEQLEYILNKLNSLEGGQGIIDPAEFCIITDLDIPKDFKIPDFPKYDGTGDPKVHVYMYTSRMGAYLKNDKMMMYYFQESLKDSAIRWYLNLDKKEIRSWHDLANAFVRHYKHNIGCAPDKSSLKKLRMSKGEDFRTFALRWRNQAAQVEPPMTEKELIDAFMEIEDLNKQYKVACATATDFSHLLSTGSRIEAALKSSPDAPEGSRKKKEGGIQHVIANTTSPAQFTQSPYRAPYRANYQPQYRPQVYYQPPTPTQQVHIQTPQQGPPAQRRNPPTPHYPPLPVSQAEIYKQLVAGGLLGPIPTQPWKPPFPA